MPQGAPGTILAWGAEGEGRRVVRHKSAARQGTSLKATWPCELKGGKELGECRAKQAGTDFADAAARCSHAPLGSRTYSLGSMGVECVCDPEPTLAISIPAQGPGTMWAHPRQRHQCPDP